MDPPAHTDLSNRLKLIPKLMPFNVSEEARKDLLATIPETFSARFYEPTVHGMDLKARFASEHHRLLRSDQFSTDVNALLTEVDAYPIEFFHETERRIGLWKAIGVSFFPRNGTWMFQDVLVDGLADSAGIQPGAELVAIDGAAVGTSTIPKFSPRENVQITYKNPGQGSNAFTFNPFEKRDPNSIRYVIHRKITDRIGYIRISKWSGILGIEVARATDAAIRSLVKPSALIVDIRGNLGSEGAGNLRLMSYLTPDKRPVGYSLTRARAEQGYQREELVQFTKIPSNQLLAPLTLLKFKDVDKSIVVVTEGLGKQPFHGRVLLLVNEHTISGAEIVAGFAADNKLATLVGTRTAGKLLGWTTVSLPHEYFLTLPTVNYLTWEGKSFERTGVLPDVNVQFSPDAAVSGVDNQLEAAIELAKQIS